MKFPHVICILVLVTMLGLSACAPKAAPAPVPTPEKPAATSPAEKPSLSREQQLIEAAKKEGQVELWTQSWPVEAGLEKAFMAKYPFLRFTTWDSPTAPGLIARLSEESKVGRHSADLMIVAETDIVGAQEADLLQENNWPTAGWQGQPSHKLWANIISAAYFPMYNTELVSAAEAPKSFADLKNSKWRGRAGISTSGRGIPLYTAYIFGEGKVDFEKSESYWKDVVSATRPMVMSGYTGTLGRLAAGEFAILLMSASSSANNLMWIGAPIAPATLEAAPEHGYSLALLKNAPHPNAAQLLIDFLTGPEGNLLYANAQASKANNPEAAKKAKANLYFDRSGLKLSHMPAEIYTAANSERASKFWSTEMPRAAGR